MLGIIARHRVECLAFALDHNRFDAGADAQLFEEVGVACAYRFAVLQNSCPTDIGWDATEEASTS